MSSSTRKKIFSYLMLFFGLVASLLIWFYCLVQIVTLREDRAKFPNEEIWVLPRFGWEGTFNQILTIHLLGKWVGLALAVVLFARFAWLAAADLGWRAHKKM